MIIVGIDPGTEESAYMILSVIEEAIEVVAHNIVNNHDLFKDAMDRVLDYDPDGLENIDVALEMVASYGMPVGKTTFETVFWIGRFYEVFESNACDVYRYYKKTDINPEICFNSMAKDKNIRQALLDMFHATGGGKTPQVGTKSKPGPLYGVATHVWAALAVAMTHAFKKQYLKRENY